MTINIPEVTDVLVGLVDSKDGGKTWQRVITINTATQLYVITLTGNPVGLAFSASPPRSGVKP